MRSRKRAPDAAGRVRYERDRPHDIPDPKDAVFLALAKAAVGWLVTGNLKHFPRAARHGVVVHSPAEYLERLEGRSPRLLRA